MFNNADNSSGFRGIPGGLSAEGRRSNRRHHRCGGNQRASRHRGRGEAGKQGECNRFQGSRHVPQDLPCMSMTLEYLKLATVRRPACRHQKMHPPPHGLRLKISSRRLRGRLSSRQRLVLAQFRTFDSAARMVDNPDNVPTVMALHLKTR